MMILAPTNRRVIRPYDKPSFEHTQRYGLIRGHWANENRVGLWLFNEGSGNTVQDLSGNVNSLTLNGTVSWTSGQFGSALDFGGGYLLNNTANNLPSTIGSISVWVNIDATANNVFFTLSDGTANNEISFYNSVAELLLFINGGGSGNNVWQKTNPVLTPGKLQHLVATWDSGTDDYKVYLDGSLLTPTGTLTAGNPTGVDNINIGIYSDEVTYPFSGILDVPLIYGRILSASEIAQLYREPFLGIQREPRITYFFVPTGGVVYQELNLTVTADASVAETDTHSMVDTGKAVQADAAVTESDTQQMVETGKEVSVDASVSCTDLKVVFELNLTVNAAGSVVATEAHTMMETGKSVTAVASPAVIDTQTMLETGLGVSAEGSVSCTDTMVLLAHIAAFMILRQCTT